MTHVTIDQSALDGWQMGGMPASTQWIMQHESGWQHARPEPWRPSTAAPKPASTVFIRSP